MVINEMDEVLGHGRGGGLSPTATLKNVGLICEACGAGKHYDCIVLTDSSKHMCLCNYTTHPYLSRDQLSKPLIPVVVPTQAGVAAKQGLGETVYPGRDSAPRLAKEIR